MPVTIKRGFEIMSDRYKYDFGVMTYGNGWAQVDTTQDASYYGTWTNPERREIFNYCEGDTCLTVCDTDAEYVQALREMAEWNKERGYWIGVEAHTLRSPLEALGLVDLLH